MSSFPFRPKPANPGAPITTSTVSKAMTAVFDTNELMHLIIKAVPTEHRTSLLRVSKAWKAAILKLGHVLGPTGYECCFLMGASHPGVPLYRSVTPFKFNRAIFNYTSNASRGVSNTYTTLTPQPYWDAADLAMLGHEFVTDPPITQLALSDGGGHVASLRVPGGIRVGDLLEYLPKVTQMSYPHLFETWAVYARPRYLGAEADVDSVATIGPRPRNRQRTRRH
jgi:hypothetical protein